MTSIFLATHAIVNVKNIKLNYTGPFSSCDNFIAVKKLYFMFSTFTRLTWELKFIRLSLAFSLVTGKLI
jgi:hypothetical protein